MLLRIIVITFSFLVVSYCELLAECYCDPLPPPGAEETVVTVHTASDLQDEIENASGPKTIYLESGVYSVNTGWWITVTNPDITIRSLSGNRDDVIIQGQGMGPKPGFGIQVYESRVTIADLTIRDVGNHPIQAAKTEGRNTDDLLFHNIRCIDAGEQLFKSSGGDMYRGIIECSVFEYTTTINEGCYTNGIDLVGTHDWIIRDCIIRNIKGASCLAGPAILIWPAGSGIVCSNTTIERNVIIDCDMGIAFGNPSAPGVNHTGGIIRNNFVKGYSGSDFGIAIIKSSDAKVINNTIYCPGNWLYSIEVQHEEATNCLIMNNLHDEPMWINRFGINNPTLITNKEYFSADIFVDADNANLHLVSDEYLTIINAGTNTADRTTDIDCQNIYDLPDIGADEYVDSFIGLSLRALLQGPYDSQADTMVTDLNKGGFIPLESPYNSAPPQIVSALPENVVDWVLVQLRETDGTSIVTQKSAFFRSDGYVIDEHGNSELIFDNLDEDNYYVILDFRNHLRIMSSSPIHLSTITSFYDFTTGVDKYYGAGKCAIELESGVWGLWSGDGDSNEILDADDFFIWFDNSYEGQKGYNLCDYNLDGDVTTLDYTLWYNNELDGAVSQVPE